MTTGRTRPGDSLGGYLKGIQDLLWQMEADDVVGRIWRKDHTVWKPDPAEIEDRLGWLTVPQLMRREIPALESFAREIREASYRHVVLLGMGGSSLGPEVLRCALGSAQGYPQLIVLDSTVPAVVQGVSDAIDPANTLFLVSSKSGSTIEPNCLYAYFRGLVDSACGQRAGDNFIAITDPGTVLERLASDAGFRRTFLNPTDIGGRYSVLSYFGLVPGALLGIDTRTLLERAETMAQECGPDRPASKNPGAWLGAAMAQMVSEGRDKLTLVTSPHIESFGLWIEQLLAESTGKEGKGIIPVVGEPHLSPEGYGEDRQFVYLRLEDDDNVESDDFALAIAEASHPLIRIDLQDRYDLGAEFYRWEFATAIAGAVLGIHPFDQPDVQAAKDMTDAMLAHVQQTGEFPAVQAETSFDQLLVGIQPDSYVAILAYCQQTTEVDASISLLRQRIAQRYGVATTAGYGPRYLHSTGQLHKGGPASGVYLLLTTDPEPDVPIAGRPYTFGQLAQAQAMGDLRALRAASRPVAWVRLDDYVVGSIDSLAASIG